MKRQLAAPIAAVCAALAMSAVQARTDHDTDNAGGLQQTLNGVIGGGGSDSDSDRGAGPLDGLTGALGNAGSDDDRQDEANADPIQVLERTQHSDSDNDESPEEDQASGPLPGLEGTEIETAPGRASVGISAGMPDSEQSGGGVDARVTVDSGNSDDSDEESSSAGVSTELSARAPAPSQNDDDDEDRSPAEQAASEFEEESEEAEDEAEDAFGG